MVTKQKYIKPEIEEIVIPELMNAELGKTSGSRNEDGDAKRNNQWQTDWDEKAESQWPEHKSMWDD